MKATGVVRRIDELGRIVIPKEIRKTLRIKESDNLEIYVDDSENIVLKKYSVLNKLGDFAQNLADSVNFFAKHNVIITDNNQIIAAAGNLKKEVLKKNISTELENRLLRREEMLEKHAKLLKITDTIEMEGTYAINTIIANGDAVGLVLIFTNDSSVGEMDMRICQIAAQFLKKHLEN